MARETEGKGKEGSRSDISTVDAIRAIAAFNARAELDSEEQLLLFLQSWWSRTYNRPLKDPILLSYTTEELIYEFYDKIERRIAEDERSSKDSDKIEEDKEKAVLDWAEEEERKELEAMKAQAENAQNPTQDPENIAWMEDQLRAAKSAFGEDFGEDISTSFEEDD